MERQDKAKAKGPIKSRMKRTWRRKEKGKEHWTREQHPKLLKPLLKLWANICRSEDQYQVSTGFKRFQHVVPAILPLFTSPAVAFPFSTPPAILEAAQSPILRGRSKAFGDMVGDVGSGVWGTWIYGTIYPLVI